MVASLMGGAILLFSCQGEKKASQVNLEKMVTQQSDTLTMIYTKNGKKDYRFYTPLMERYELARDPYMEFRYGIHIITYDSLGADASDLVADYAIFYERRELWECRGNVVGKGEDGRTLYTQQLFWDQKTDKVYSNVDCKIVDGTDTFVGEGFESDSEFNDWVFRESEGRMWVDASQASDEEIEQAEREEQERLKEQERLEQEKERLEQEKEEQRRAEQAKRREDSGLMNPRPRDVKPKANIVAPTPRPDNNVSGDRDERGEMLNGVERPSRNERGEMLNGVERPVRPRPNDMTNNN